MNKLPVLALIFLAGCSTIRQGAIDISEENVLNAEAMRQVATTCISVWPIQSGFIKGALGNRISELPSEAVEAMAELDRLADLPEQTDEQKGFFLGLKVRLLGSVIQIALERYAPNIYLPLIF